MNLFLICSLIITAISYIKVFKEEKDLPIKIGYGRKIFLAIESLLIGIVYGLAITVFIFCILSYFDFELINEKIQYDEKKTKITIIEENNLGIEPGKLYLYENKNINGNKAVDVLQDIEYIDRTNSDKNLDEKSYRVDVYSYSIRTFTLLGKILNRSEDQEIISPSKYERTYIQMYR